MLYAAKTGKVDSSGFSFYWNGKKIAEVMGKDADIHQYEVVLEANEGENTLSVKGESKSDREGMSIANLRLTKG